MKYRKKPVVIEAVQLLDNDKSIVDAVEFVFAIGMETCAPGMLQTISKIKKDGGFEIPTLEGNMKASFGDWIIRGVNGEYYPCKPDIFEKTYESIPCSNINQVPKTEAVEIFAAKPVVIQAAMDKYERYKRVPFFNVLVHTLENVMELGYDERDIIEAMELANEIRLERKSYHEHQALLMEALIADAKGNTKSEGVTNEK